MRAAIMTGLLLMTALLGIGVCAEKQTASPAGEQPASYAYLASWEKKYPLGMGYSSFFEEPNVKALIKKTIPDAWMKKVLQWTVNDPFERQGDVLIATLCKPRDCGSYFANIFFDLAKGRLQMCVTETDPKTEAKKATWVGATVRKLEDGSCGPEIEIYRKYGDK